MLVSMKYLLDVANKNNFAVAAPNVNHEMNVRSVIQAAEEMNAPLIIDIAYSETYDIEFLGPLTKKLCEEASVPIAINLDHGGSRYKEFEPCLAEVMHAIRAGFTSVMVDRSSLPYEDNVEQVKYVSKLAHTLGVTVEAELGHVGSGSLYGDPNDTRFTEPEEAKRYIEETGIDCLAVSVGTAHGVYKGVPQLDYERLQKIKEITGAPLVLHGGSGTGDEKLRKACTMGINKVNVATDLYRSAADRVLATNLDGSNVYKLWPAIYDGWKDRLKELIEVFGSAGKASLYDVTSCSKSAQKQIERGE